MLFRKNDVERVRLEQELRENTVEGDDESDEVLDAVDHYYYLEFEAEGGVEYRKPSDCYARFHRARPDFYYYCNVESPADEFWRKPDRVYESYYL
jgi:hypothetical protein